MKNTYVLIHGAWLGNWCFDKVRPMLEKEGHRVIAPNLPGHGDNLAPIEQQDIHTYADFIVGLLRAQEEPVILLGHSMGGMSISHAASIIPEKVKKLVYVTAFLPRDGQSNDGPTDGIKHTDWEAMADAGQGVTLTRNRKAMALDPELSVALLYNELPREEALEYIKLQGEESLAAPHQAVRITDAFYTIPKIYVRCTKDAIMLPELQDKMIAATPCEAVYDLDADHSPYFSNPEGLVEILLKL